MWQTDSLWFEVAIVSITITLGHILLGHFEERTISVRKFLKYIMSLIKVVGLSLLFGRTVALMFFAISFIPVLYIYLVMLPIKGINGWSGEPKSKYCEYRKWSKELFKDEKQ